MKLKEIIYNQILQEVRQQDVIFSYDGRAVVDTSHATARFLERVRNISFDKLCDLYTQMIKRVIHMDSTKSVPAEEMLVYSKKLDQAVIVAYRYDRFDSQDNNKNFYIMTYLPRGKKTPRAGTTALIVEAHNDHLLNCSPELMTYLSNIVQNRRIKLNEDTVNYDYIPVVLANGLDYKIILHENKIYDVNLEILEF
jgi:hypothetical protein